MIRLLSFHKVCFPKLNHVITSWLPRPGCTEGEITPGGQYGKKLWRLAHSIAIYTPCKQILIAILTFHPSEN